MIKSKKLDGLREYFKINVGPVLCTPSMELLHRYGLMEGMVGIIHPLTEDEIKRETILLKIDWSLNVGWSEIVDQYSTIAGNNCHINEINLIHVGKDVPTKPKYQQFGDYDWKPGKLGDIVCISDYRFTLYQKNYPLSLPKYKELKKHIGVIIERCSNLTTSAMVSFNIKGNTKVINIPIDLLVKLPESFRPNSQKKEDMSVITKAKFSIGQIVRVSSSVVDETFMGLIGVIDKTHEIQPNGFKNISDWEYTVDFDLLPNRCLSICEGENGQSDIITVTHLKERDLDEWNEKVSDKAHFGVYRSYSKRAKVWVPHKGDFGVVQVKSNPKKSLGEGMSIEVEVQNKKLTMSCRDVDYLWDPDALLTVLSESFVCLGVEEDERNPNIAPQQYVYLYVFDYAKDVGKYVQYRILLGTLLKKQSIAKKFARALLINKLTHPWQVHRYLKRKSLGYFYQLFTANEYVKKIGDFAHAE